MSHISDDAEHSDFHTPLAARMDPKSLSDWIAQDYGFPSNTIRQDRDSPEYITITSSGIKMEGEYFGAMFFSESAARKGLDFYLSEYFEGKTKVWWRRKPEVAHDCEVFYRNVGFPLAPVGGIRLDVLDTYIAICRVYAE